MEPEELNQEDCKAENWRGIHPEDRKAEHWMECARYNHDQWRSFLAKTKLLAKELVDADSKVQWRAVALYDKERYERNIKKQLSEEGIHWPENEESEILDIFSWRMIKALSNVKKNVNDLRDKSGYTEDQWKTFIWRVENI
ncbi:hypothetical protein T440DRAFT_473673, partial [Plenodomus tracheiphilus IPT5]